MRGINLTNFWSTARELSKLQGSSAQESPKWAPRSGEGMIITTQTPVRASSHWLASAWIRRRCVHQCRRGPSPVLIPVRYVIGRAAMAGGFISPLRPRVKARTELNFGGIVPDRCRRCSVHLLLAGGSIRDISSSKYNEHWGKRPWLGYRRVGMCFILNVQQLPRQYPSRISNNPTLCRSCHPIRALLLVED